MKRPIPLGQVVVGGSFLLAYAVLWWLAVIVTELVRQEGDFAGGWEAYERNDYQAALDRFVPPATEGNRNAQFMLGALIWCYREQRGVPSLVQEGRRPRPPEGTFLEGAIRLRPGPCIVP